MLLGCIGDDFTGSSDLANTLAKGGMATTLFCGVPQSPAASAVEAGVVALKTRSIAADEAVEQSLAALRWLKAQGCRQFFFKFCSTFDSTPAGNIGPVADALADALDAPRVVVCPAFPTAGRTVFHGHLFVGDQLLSESGMATHPLNPMTDPDIRRVLARQSRRPVTHVPHRFVRAGATHTRQAIEGAGPEDSLIVVDATSDDDLRAIGQAVAQMPLVAGASGLALGLPENFRGDGQLAGHTFGWTPVDGPAVILSGSCSTATRRQVEFHRRSHPSLEVTAEAIMTGALGPSDALEWAVVQRDLGPLIYSSADPSITRAAQSRFGAEALAARIEGFFATAARLLVAHGFSRLVVAGGETSGAVVTGLGCTALSVGPEVDPGIPLMLRADGPIALALKSGNFGSDEFFEKALARMAGRHE